MSVQIEMVGGNSEPARRLLLRADTGQGPLVDITDPGRPQTVDVQALPLTDATQTRLHAWVSEPLRDRDLRWCTVGAAVASALEDELDGTAVHYANGQDDHQAPGPDRPPGGGRTYLICGPPQEPTAYSSSFSVTFGAPRPEPPRVLATDEDDAELAELKRRVVEPVVHGLLTDAEYRSSRVYRRSDEPDVVLVDVMADRDAHVGGWLVWSRHGDPTVEEIAARLASDLEDWVAESRFAWGEQRRAVYVIPAARPTG